MDKLPQLWNVLADEMSVVGPRPRVVGSSAIDSRTMPSLQAVQPGIIGPWSISPAYPAPADELRDELSYVRKWTIWLDAQLAIITVLSIFNISKHARPDLAPNRDVMASVEAAPTSSISKPSN
jgi:lipopolysaccharide/colanic/teichoic acid biosynthesis glycosyltransferase